MWRLDRFDLPPSALLGAVILTSALLSAVFSNDIVCLAMAPVLADACRARRLDPVPFLLALACAANLGSAATLIGNPQNMLIGERLALDFGGYLRLAVMPVGLGLAATWLILLGLSRRRRHPAASAPVAAKRDLETKNVLYVADCQPLSCYT